MKNSKLITDPVEALHYVTECNLATVSSLAHSKKTSKRELTRAINIAATGLYTLMSLVKDSPTSFDALDLRCKERATEAIALAKEAGKENAAWFAEEAITAWVESIRSE